MIIFLAFLVYFSGEDGIPTEDANKSKAVLEKKKDEESDLALTDNKSSTSSDVKSKEVNKSDLPKEPEPESEKQKVDKDEETTGESGNAGCSSTPHDKVSNSDQEALSEGQKEPTVSEVVKESGCESSKSNASDTSESVYHIKWVTFKRNKVPIITQNENGPCPLLAIMNVLLLQNRVHLNPQCVMVSASQLMAHLGDCVLENVPGEEVGTC